MSHPFCGAEFTFRQPDGQELKVKGWGDQNRARFETLDGYTVVRNSRTGFFEYANLSRDGDEDVASGRNGSRFSGRWWDRSSTGLSIKAIGLAGASISFKVEAPATS